MVVSSVTLSIGRRVRCMVLSLQGLGRAAGTWPDNDDHVDRVHVDGDCCTSHAGWAGELLGPPEKHVTAMVLSCMGSFQESGCRYTFLEDARYTVAER